MFCTDTAVQRMSRTLPWRAACATATLPLGVPAWTTIVTRRCLFATRTRGLAAGILYTPTPLHSTRDGILPCDEQIRRPGEGLTISRGEGGATSCDLAGQRLSHRIGRCNRPTTIARSGSWLVLVPMGLRVFVASVCRLTSRVPVSVLRGAKTKTGPMETASLAHALLVSYLLQSPPLGYTFRGFTSGFTVSARVELVPPDLPRRCSAQASYKETVSCELVVSMFECA